MSNPASITPVILSGGSGTRLWPLSRSARPKQFLDFAGDGTMLEQTLARVAQLNPALNAISLLRPDAARAVAAGLDAELAACSTDAQRQALLHQRPFFGVPLLLTVSTAAATPTRFQPFSSLGTR